MTSDQNAEVHGVLQEFLLKLSTHYLNQDVLKILEYLLRNFDAHQYESEELILYFLPFHNTRYYIRIL